MACPPSGGKAVPGRILIWILDPGLSWQEVVTGMTVREPDCTYPGPTPNHPKTAIPSPLHYSLYFILGFGHFQGCSRALGHPEAGGADLTPGPTLLPGISWYRTQQQGASPPFFSRE